MRKFTKLELLNLKKVFAEHNLNFTEILETKKKEALNNKDYETASQIRFIQINLQK